MLDLKVFLRGHAPVPPWADDMGALPAGWYSSENRWYDGRTEQYVHQDYWGTNDPKLSFCCWIDARVIKDLPYHVYVRA